MSRGTERQVFVFAAKNNAFVKTRSLVALPIRVALLITNQDLTPFFRDPFLPRTLLAFSTFRIFQTLFLSVLAIEVDVGSVENDA